jgi:hypothetical protein
MSPSKIEQVWTSLNKFEEEKQIKWWCLTSSEMLPLKIEEDEKNQNQMIIFVYFLLRNGTLRKLKKN